ncbi:hypothetical protein SAMN06269185_0962 [Natronoarchaeum philippinense]|uniref:Small CPxCG-related zinc finger protein n=1 Tax=Natronoarchaeum philippinense TaxID=558529 RepID=A0A285N8U7_NATPI|nr:hypothetical protein [Natronoarchaeum philippinense]SNZ05839.1 hypothetical protein SAMN06269185_0962 [Natronoarchaeum philippinense]
MGKTCAAQMSAEKVCPDCEEPLVEMELQGTSAMGSLTIVAEATDDGFLSGIRADEILTPVPYVCPECRRTLVYAEE